MKYFSIVEEKFRISTPPCNILYYYAWLFPSESGMKWESQNQLIREDFFWKMLTWTKPKDTKFTDLYTAFMKGLRAFFVPCITKPQNVNIIETTGFHSFIGLFRFTILFSCCPWIAKDRLGGQCLHKTKYALQMVLNWQVNKSQVSIHTCISFLVLFRQHGCHEISCKPAMHYLIQTSYYISDVLPISLTQRKFLFAI